MLKTRTERLFAGGALVLACVVLSAGVTKRVQSGVEETAPAYRVKGAASAPIVIVEFSDFQCPACRVAEEPLKKLLELYGDDARFVFKHFPLEYPHPHARRAAGMTECAGRQGKFWELHGLLYKKQESWSRAEDAPAALETLAKEAGLDMKAFAACMKDPAVDAAVLADMKEGDRRWVGSTPTFFINKRRFVGARQLQVKGTAWIEKQLKKRP